MGHECHHPTCKKQVPPEMMACKSHWFELPKNLRDKVWSAYVPGQEIRKDPTPKYMQVYRECQSFWIANG